MPLVRDIEKEVKTDIRAAKKFWLPWWAVMSLIVAGVPIVWLVDRYGKLNLVMPTSMSIAAVLLAVTVTRRLWRHAWYWGTVAILAALHVPLILLVPWTTKWVPAAVYAGSASADLILMLVILAVVEGLMDEPDARVT